MTHEEKITYWEAKADEACARYDRLCDRYGDISTNDNCDKLNENIEFARLEMLTAERRFDECFRAGLTDKSSGISITF